MARPMDDKIVHLTRQQLIEMSKNFVTNKSDDVEKNMDGDSNGNVNYSKSRRKDDKSDTQRGQRRMKPEQELYRPGGRKESNMSDNKVELTTEENKYSSAASKSKSASTSSRTSVKSNTDVCENLSKLTVQDNPKSYERMPSKEHEMPVTTRIIRSSKRPDREIYVPKKMRDGNTDPSRASAERDDATSAAENIGHRLSNERRSGTPGSSQNSERNTPERSTGAMSRDGGDQMKKRGGGRSWTNSKRFEEKNKFEEKSSGDVSYSSQADNSTHNRPVKIANQDTRASPYKSVKELDQERHSEGFRGKDFDDSSQRQSGKDKMYDRSDDRTKNNNEGSYAADKKKKWRNKKNKTAEKKIGNNDSSYLVEEEPELEWDDKADVGLAEDFSGDFEFDHEAAMLDDESNDWVDIGETQIGEQRGGRRKHRNRKPRQRKKNNLQTGINVDNNFVESDVRESESQEKNLPLTCTTINNSSVKFVEKMSKEEINKYVDREGKDSSYQNNLRGSEQRNDDHSYQDKYDHDAKSSRDGGHFKRGFHGRYSAIRNQRGTGSSSRGGRAPPSRQNETELSAAQAKKIDGIFRQNGDSFEDEESAGKESKNRDNVKQLSWAEQCEIEEDKPGNNKGGIIRVTNSSKAEENEKRNKNTNSPVSSRANIKQAKDSNDPTDFYHRKETGCRPTTNRTLWDPSKPIPMRSSGTTGSDEAISKDSRSNMYSRTSRVHSTSESDQCVSESEYPSIKRSQELERRKRLDSDEKNMYDAYSTRRRGSLELRPDQFMHSGFVPVMPMVDNYRLDFVGQGSLYGGQAMYDPYYQCYDQGMMNPMDHTYESGKHDKSDSIIGRFNFLLNDSAYKESQLANLLYRNAGGNEIISRVLKIRQEIQVMLEEALLLDLDISNQQNIDQRLWKVTYHQIIESFRRHLKEENSGSAYRKHLLTVLDEGTKFYESLLTEFQSKYKFSLESYLDPEKSFERVGRSVKLALVFCQKFMICLGDLSRYREQAVQSFSYGRARSWYLKAQQIAPKNGKPYNQLAVLATYTGRKLEAAYYYIRSLSATNPFLSARECLMTLFDEATRKADHYAKIRHQRVAEKRRKKAAAALSGGRGREHEQRVELWISADQTRNESIDKDLSGDEDEEELSGLNMAELSKRFSLNFMNVHGKLFTKIGMETFMEAAGLLMKQFKRLLNHSPSPMTQQRLLQLMAMNMFAIDNARALSAAAASADGSTDPDNSGCRLLIQEQAVQLGLSVYGMIVQRCSDILKEQFKRIDLTGQSSSVTKSPSHSAAASKTSDTSTEESEKHTGGREASCLLVEDLEHLLPCVKIWSDWMTCHSSTWNPPPLPFDPQLGPTVDVWDALAEFFNTLTLIDISTVKLSDSKTDGGVMISLVEDQFLAGYVPLLSLSLTPSYTTPDASYKEGLAQNFLRVSRLLTFADYLCGIEPPLLSYDVESRSYQSAVVMTHQENKNKTDNKQPAAENDNDDIIVEDDSDVVEEFSEPEDERQEITELRAKKRLLTQQITQQVKQQESIQAALEGDKKRARAVELEIRPTFLVPDTNCFIDHLRSLRHLVSSGRYTLFVPLVVINELDHLAHGGKEGESAEHVEMVRNSAVLSMEYLQTEFESRNSRLRAITSKGTRLDTIAFRSEVDSEGNNDDVILSCCLHFCKDMARDFMPKTPDAPIRLQRDVVLLTNDRNLRLKAHLHNVPVKDVPSFMRWANL